ncbi:MAG: serine hydrolase [Desulfobacteraceae bacterium]
MSWNRRTTLIYTLVRFFIIFYLLFITAACASDDSSNSADGVSGSDTDSINNTDTSNESDDNEKTDMCRNAFENQMTNILKDLETDTDFTLFLETEDGHAFTFNRGDSTLFTSYLSASTSKWVFASIILRLVDQEILSLTDRPQDHIPNWEIPESDPLYEMTLYELLSLTSGLSIDNECVNHANSDFENCIRDIAKINIENGDVPGVKFDYNHNHFQVAALMAIKAAGVDTWQDIYENFKAETGLFADSAYDYPSLNNPRMAAGMHWQASDYIDFIRAFQFGNLLTDKSKSQMLMDYIRTSAIVNSPIVDSLNEEWHYGLGIWLECPQENFNCQTIYYYSSPGIYGAYPFMNTQYNFFGIVARMGNIDTIAQGKAVYDAVSDLAEQWAQVPASCQ